MSVMLSPSAPDGFLVFSHAGDDRAACVAYVRERLGLPTLFPLAPRRIETRARKGQPEIEAQRRIARAVGLWGEGVRPRGTLAERYLAGRGLELPADVAGAAIRFHPTCPWRDEASDAVVFMPAMLTAMRGIHDDRIVAVQRTALRPDGTKIGRRMLGLAGGAAIKLDPNDTVTTGLTIGEGTETCLAARQLAFRPAWALGSASSIASFPVLGGIECLTILAELDDSGANARAVQECGNRWHQAGREVIVVEPRTGGDVNDAWKAVA